MVANEYIDQKAKDLLLWWPDDGVLCRLRGSLQDDIFQLASLCQLSAGKIGTLRWHVSSFAKKACACSQPKGASN